jgi:hypothetical protein
MIDKFGSDQQQLANSGGSVISQDNAVLINGDSNGEGALLFGPAALREIQAGVANGSFAIPPSDSESTITEDNALPYWTFTDVNSAGGITAALVADTGAASGYVLRFTVGAGTTTGKSATLSRFVPVASSASRSFAFYAEATFETGTSTYQATAKLSGQFYKSDQETTTGSELFSDTYRFDLLQSPTGITAPNLYGVAPDLTVMTAPADAAYLKLTITIATTTASVSNVARTLTTATVTTIGVHGFAIGQSATVALTSGPAGYTALNGTWTITGTPTPTTFTFTTVTSGTITSGAAIGTVAVPAATDRTVDLTEVRLAHGLPELILAEKEDPATYPPGLITAEFGHLTLVSGTQDALTIAGDSFMVASTSISLTSGGGISLSPEVGSAVDVMGDLIVNGDANFYGANSEWVSRIAATAAQSLGNNSLVKITFNTASSTPDIGSYDPQGWFNNANDRIVVGQAGFYNITANVGFASNATSRRLILIYVNGDQREGVQVPASPSGTTLLSISTNVYLEATDYVEVYALQQSGGALNTVISAGVTPFLSVGRIGG